MIASVKRKNHNKKTKVTAAVKKDMKGRHVVNKQRLPESLKVVSLFSGCGGLDLGFVGNFTYRHFSFPKNRFEIVFSNDIDSAAENVYKANSKYFGNHAFSRCDVKSLDYTALPDFDFLIAGFPCQPFSNAGLRKGINDERGTLFEECERILKEANTRKKKPLGFLFENVKGILSSRMPDGTTVPEEITRRMDKLGYKTVYKLLKTSDFGAPTNRQRLIMLGIKKEYKEFDFGLLNTVISEHSLPTPKDNPYDLYLGSILCDIPKNSPQLNDYWKYSPAGQSMVEKIGTCKDGKEALSKFRQKVPLFKISETITEGKSWKNMPPTEMSERFKKIWYNPQKYRAPNFYRRFALGEINGAIIASAQPENCGITHPFENRRFSVREIARIQSFPDDFSFPYTTIANAYKVIGNAVPPIFAWVLARSIVKHLYNE